MKLTRCSTQGWVCSTSGPRWSRFCSPMVLPTKRSFHLPCSWYIPATGNRGGFGINGYSCHSKGALICKNGAGLPQLVGAVAFEMSADKKDSQIQFNVGLAKESNGLVANPTGQKLFLSVSKGHTRQFFKATKMACPTPQQSLASSDGYLGTHLLQKDASLMQWWKGDGPGQSFWPVLSPLGHHCQG